MACARMYSLFVDELELLHRQQDELGNQGVRLSKDIIKVAGRTMQTNLTALGCVFFGLSSWNLRQV